MLLIAKVLVQFHLVHIHIELGRVRVYGVSSSWEFTEVSHHLPCQLQVSVYRSYLESTEGAYGIMNIESPHDD